MTTHVLERNGKIKPGDTVRLVDEIPLEDRIALDKLSELAEQAVLDEKAALHQAVADELKARALQRRIIDRSPHVLPPLPTVKPSFVHAQIALLCLILVAVVAVAFGTYGPARAPYPSTSKPLASSQEPQSEPKNATASRQKGRVER